MSFMFKATVATACMTLLFATSILTRDRADTGWNPQRAQPAQSTAKARASTNKELNRETENACGDKRDSPGLPDCYGAVLKQPDIADGPSAKRLSSSRNARQASGGAGPSDVQVTGSVRPVADYLPANSSGGQGSADPRRQSCDCTIDLGSTRSCTGGRPGACTKAG